MAQVLLVTHWTGGDVLPFIRLGSRLRQEGHDVILFSHCRYEETARKAGIEFVCVDTKEQYEAMNHDLYQLSDPVNHREDYLEFNRKNHGKDRLLTEVALLEPYCQRKDTFIIARHRSSVSGLLAAERYGLPYASMILAPNYFAHMQLHEEMMGSEFATEINAARTELGLKPIESWLNWLYSPNVIFGLWPEWFASRDESWPKGAKAVGFLPEDKEEDHMEWNQQLLEFIQNHRNQNHKIALITGGSSKMIDPKFYQVAADACSLASVPAILVTPYEEYVPEDLGRDIYVCQEALLRQLMKKVDLIIHHGGMGTISEAVEAALPQIILPHLTDGPDNAGRLAALKIAKKFPVSQWKAGLIAEAILDSFQDGTKSVCERYADLNEQESQKQDWNRLLREIPVYEYRENTTETTVGDQSAARKQMSREQLLAMLKRRKVQESIGHECR